MGSSTMTLRTCSIRTVVLLAISLGLLITALRAVSGNHFPAGAFRETKDPSQVSPAESFAADHASETLSEHIDVSSSTPDTAQPELAQSEENLSTIQQAKLLPLNEALDVCGQRRWRPWSRRETHRKIFDLMLINTELDWLEIRLAELENEVDYFIVVEAAKTFTDRPKPLHLKDNWDRYKRWHSKMIYHTLDSAAMAAQDAWDRERFQRDSMYDQVFPHLTGEQQANLGDVILVSDVDEIPRPSTLRALRNCQFPQRLTISSRFYYYSFQWLHRDGQEWNAPQATYYRGVNTVRPADLRDGRNDDPKIHNAGWHCSSCLPTLGDFVDKITAFSHVEYNQPDYTDRSKILTRVRNGLDLFDREGEVYDRIDDNPDVPSYLLRAEQKKKFAYLLDRDPVSGNFLDYTQDDTVVDTHGHGDGHKEQAAGDGAGDVDESTEISSQDMSKDFEPGSYGDVGDSLLEGYIPGDAAAY